MGLFLTNVVLGTICAACVSPFVANAQAVPSQDLASPAAASPPAPSNDAVEPVPDTTDAIPDPASLLPDLPPFPNEKASLIGGIVEKLDRVRDQITLQVFGGGKIKISFDPRTHFYHGPSPGSVYDMRPGDRIYVDTMLDGDTVFARNIRIKSVLSAGESQGTVIGYRSDKGELRLRDALSPQPLMVHINSQTRVVEGDRSASADLLTEGTLVAVKFGPQQNGGNAAREISILAVAGASFTFAGRVQALNLRLGILVLTSSTDHKTYEISIDPSVLPADNSLQEATDVTVLARFDGQRYVATSLTVNSR